MLPIVGNHERYTLLEAKGQCAKGGRYAFLHFYLCTDHFGHRRLGRRELIEDAYGFAFQRADGGLILIFRPEAQAPATHRLGQHSATGHLQRREHFSATFRFNVGTNGRTENIELIESEGGRVWEDNAQEALAGYLYAPMIIAGEPVRVQGLEQTLSFTFDRR